MASIEGWMMDMLSVEESDAVYQSFRSKTRIGLEVGSVVVGGCAVVKGTLAFNRLARLPMQVSRLKRF